MQLSPRTVFYLTLDVALIIFCLFHLPEVHRRATLPVVPVVIEQRENVLAVAEVLDARAAGELRLGDEVTHWNDLPLVRPEVAEFLADLASIGDTVLLQYTRDGHTRASSVTLIPYYPSLRFLIITVVIGLFSCVTAIFVLVHRPGNLVATTLHWMMMSLGVTVMITWGRIQTGSLVSLIDRSIFVLSYIGTASLFLFFTFLYPQRKTESLTLIASVIFVPVLLLSAGMIYYHLRAIQHVSVEDFLTFQSVFDLFRALLFVAFGVGILNILRSFRNARLREERQRLQWLLWGLSIGSVPFLLLYLLPQLLFSTYFVDEEYTTIAFLAVPFSFAVSFIKYRLLDVEVVIHRSILYAVLSLVVVAAYGLIVLLVSTFINPDATLEEYFAVAGLTVLVGLLLNPLRKKIQRFIDEMLFPARTSFRKTVTDIGNRLHEALSIDGLVHQFIQSLQKVLFLQTIAVYRYLPGRLELQQYYGRPLRPRLLLRNEHLTLFTEAGIFATKDVLAFERADINIQREELLRRLGCGVCLPLLSESKQLLGVVAAQPSATSGKFSEEEIDLLRATSTMAAEVLDRLILYGQMVEEQQERRKAEELSSLKSDFVSYVSHEFQNPLTSIRLYSEILRKRSSDPQVQQFIDVIDGEAGRLSRMVTTVLDAARIEQGLKEYSFQEVDLAREVRQAVNAMKYQLRKYRFRVALSLPHASVVAKVDRDAFGQALVNLISNAIKYGQKGRFIRLALVPRKQWIACSVEDHGQGISPEVQTHLFEKYYRDPAMSKQIRGVGLGLSLVKHIMEAHGGKVEVRSRLGRGTTFTLLFPTHRKQNITQ